MKWTKHKRPANPEDVNVWVGRLIRYQRENGLTMDELRGIALSSYSKAAREAYYIIYDAEAKRFKR